MVTVACVYKIGGDYFGEYVRRLVEGVAASTTRPHRFVCLTDSPEDLPCETIPLTDNLPGYWSKLELFKPHLPGRVVYLDLDTIITGNIDQLLDYVGDVAMLHDETHANRMPADWREWGSGVMAWNAPLQFVYPLADEVQQIRTLPRGGDQLFIADRLRQARQPIDKIQDVVSVASYRLRCQYGVPADTRIVYFHGHPRPHEINWKLQHE